MANNTELPSGYDYEFVDEVPEEYICCICHLTMRNPVQTKCGHRFCKDCLNTANQGSGNKIHAPSQWQCPVDREVIFSPGDIFDDKATERKILSFKIKCPNQDCHWQGELRNAQSHNDECPLAIVPCSYQRLGCDLKVSRKSLSDHIVVNHLASNAEKLLAIQDENENLKNEIKDLKDENVNLKKQVEASYKSYEKTTAQLKDNNENLKKEVEVLKQIYDTTTKQLEQISKQIIDMKDENVNLKNQVEATYKSHANTVKQLKDNNGNLKKEMKVLNQTTEELKKISKFRYNYKVESVDLNVPDIMLYSDPFYTDNYGYKLKLRVDPNGNGNGNGTHLSVFVIVMRGEYDAVLPWPFNNKVKFTLVDQKPDLSKRKNIESTFIPGSTSNDECFKRPTTDENVGLGYQTFASHEKLKTENYVVDNTLYLQVELEHC